MIYMWLHFSFLYTEVFNRTMFNLVCMCMQAGPRAVPDSRPDLIRRRVFDFAAELELPAIPVHHFSS